jgi:hypothetical protein
MLGAAHICVTMKKRRRQTDRQTDRDWFSGLAADFYDADMQKLVTQYNKCLNLHGDYVEKLFDVCSKDVKYFFFFYSFIFFNQMVFTFWMTYMLLIEYKKLLQY